MKKNDVIVKLNGKAVTISADALVMILSKAMMKCSDEYNAELDENGLTPYLDNIGSLKFLAECLRDFLQRESNND